MFRFLTCITFLLVICQGQIQGDLLHTKLFEDVAFAYKIVSGIEINYADIVDDNSTHSFTVLNGGSINITEKIEEHTWFIAPIAGYSIAIGYNLPILGNATLNVTKNIIKRIINDTTILWRDPEIAALNPALAAYSPLIRIIMDSTSNDINKYLIDYFFDDYSNNTGTWSSNIKASRNPTVNGYQNIPASLALLTNSIAFIINPTATDSRSDQLAGKFKKANLLLEDQVWYTNYTIYNETQVDNETFYDNYTIFERHNTYKNFSIDQIPTLQISTINNFIFQSEINGNDSWPLNQIIYIVFDFDYIECTESTAATRFLYWLNNNTYLSELIRNDGYFDIGEPNKVLIKQLLKQVNCYIPENGSQRQILSYTNLTTGKRSNIVFVPSVVLTLIFAAVVIYAYKSHENSGKANLHLLLLHVIVIFGLLFMLIGFVLSWFPPSSTGICIARYWSISIGYINVISSLFVWAITVHYHFNAHSKDYVPKRGWTYYVLTFILLNVFNFAVLVLWTFVGNPKSDEVVVDIFNWETIYDCTVSTPVPDYIRSAYYLIVSTLGCVLIYRLWALTDAHKVEKNKDTVEKTKLKSPDDMRFLLAALYNQILVFGLILVLGLLNITDDQEYIIVIPLFLFSITNVIFSLFLQRILRKIRKRINSSKSLELDESKRVALPKSDNNSLGDSVSDYSQRRKSIAMKQEKS
jgi:ABC-type phosphate transport system substrate-binding protein